MIRRLFLYAFCWLLIASALCIGQLALGAPAVQAQATSAGSEYIVQPGDSLYKISERFYGDPARFPQIVAATNTKAAEDASFATITNPTLIRVGQKLWIPDLAASSNTPASTPNTVSAAPLPSVRFETPLNGAVISGAIPVAMAATGLIVEPAGELHDNAGHFHILVDSDFVEAGTLIPFDATHRHFSRGQLTTTLPLPPGEHVLRLQFGDSAHIALDGDPYRETITVTVTGEDISPSVRFATPLAGATVPPSVTVAMAATGLTVEPAGEIRENAGHFHILLDTDFLEPGEVIPTDATHLHFGKGQLTTTLQLAPGEHVLRLQFADGAHIALDGDQYRDEITVTVAEGADSPGVRFATPLNGATVTPTVAVAMATTGLLVEPAGEIHDNAGHFHILVDTDFVEPGEVIPTDAQHLHFGKAQLTTTLQLAPGEHVLRLQFADGAHIALDGAQYRDEITVTVDEASSVRANAAPVSTSPSVRFVRPLDGATVTATVAVAMAASGLTVEPAGEIHDNAGHFHILVDSDFVEPGDVIPTDATHLHFGKGQITTTLQLTPGTHLLRLQFADGAHIALDGAQYRDEITVTVKK